MDLRTEPLTNTQILAGIRNDASMDYVNRIPDPTQAGLKDQLDQLTKYRPLWNEFVHSLVNRIGSIIIRDMSFTNPLSEFKRSSMEYGSTIEEVAVGLVRSLPYSAEREALEKVLFGQHSVPVDTNFHSINREEFYPISINDKVLKRAFLNEQGGLNNFLAQLLKAPATSNQWDEFILTCQLLSEYDAKDGFYRVNVGDVSSIESGETTAKYALRRLRETAGEMAFLNTKYNAAGMPNFATKDELVIITTPAFNAAVDVEALAGAFNIDKANSPGRIVEIPADQMKIPGAQAFLTTPEFFIISDTLNENTSMPNPVTLHTNFFSHHQGIYSLSRFAPAVMLTTHAGTESIVIREDVTGVSAVEFFNGDGTAAPESLLRGSTYQLEAHAEMSGGSEGAVTWAVSGNKSTETRIDRNGILHVAADDSATSIDIVVTAVFGAADSNLGDRKTETTTKTLTGDIASPWAIDSVPTGITVKGEPVADFDPEDLSYTVAGAAPATINDITVQGVPYYKVTETVDDTFAVTAFSGSKDRVYTVIVTA